MALRNVTLTGTTIGSGISTVDIYHSYVDPNNLIASGVTSGDLASGYSFQDQDYRWKYVVTSDSSCDVVTNVWLPNAPITTFTEGQIVDISDNVIIDSINGIVNSITNTENDWMIYVNYGSSQSDGYIVRSDDNGQTWIKEPNSSWVPDRAITMVNTDTVVHYGGSSYPTVNGIESYNSWASFSSDGGNSWPNQEVMQDGSSGTAYAGGYIGYSFQDLQSRESSSGTKRDGNNKYCSFLGAQWRGTINTYFSTNFSYLSKTAIDSWLGTNANSGQWSNYDTWVSTSVSQSLYGYGCRIVTTGGYVKIFAGSTNGEMLKITNYSVFDTVSSGESGTNQTITAVGHNQEVMNEHGSQGSETTWLAAIDDPNQAANSQEFIMSTDDGDTWVSYVGTNMDTDYIYDIKYIKGRWYAVGKKGTEGRICSTADLNDPWEQVSTTKPCRTIGIGRDVENTKIIIGCEDGYIVQNEV